MNETHLYGLCKSPVSVSSEFAKNPTASPSSICDEVFAQYSKAASAENGDREAQQQDAIEQAFECGKWGQTRPSQLFLKIYSDVLKSLSDDPMGGVCSPNLLGSNGVCPLTIIATIPDICRHMSNLIVRAEHEVYLATNYWMLSEGSTLISNAFRELSRRASKSGRKVVVKIIYDRGNVKQFTKNHQKVPASTYADPNGKIALPKPEEIPNVLIEVVNYHRPALGTFHAKFMVVDRKIALTQSNNIQDNDNMEMMAQWEGDIVDSLYDMAIITWHNEMDPPLPCLASPASGAPTPTSAVSTFQSMFDQSGNLSPISQHFPRSTPLANGGDNLREIASESSKIDLPQHTAKDPHYDPDIASEVVRAVASLNTLPSETRVQSVARLLNGPAAGNASPSAPDITPENMFTPMIPIAPHQPFPIVMVNRPPHGALNNKSLRVPQNVAWMSALQNAVSNVFIQTPDLNAQALLPEILSACRRGVNVTYYYCLGYNDAGELLPGQGGHNEMIAHDLYDKLEPEFRRNLNIYVYVAKDQVRPIHNKFKKRSCHIKLMIVDDHIGIQGSGNQDTQSWYHSQEVNVMFDSALVCGKWMDGIRQNQNTHIYGKVESEGEHAGCWFDRETGKGAEGAIGVDPGRFAWAKGMIGAVQRVRGVGGF